MDFNDGPEDAAFRKEVRTFLQNELTDDVRGDGDPEAMYMRGTTPELTRWRHKVAKKGWVAPAWPKQYGGAGLTVMQQFVMNEEMAEHRAPNVGGMGVMMVGPTLIVHGNEDQKKEHLGRILEGDVQWCQGFSEPGSGSDLASLQTRAVRDGDDFIINGQKIWTSGAHLSDWMFLLTRTDPDAPKHKGISYFLLDMKSPGITIRPLINLAGQYMFNEVFFDNVRVPATNLVGELNRGWYIGTTTLDFERSSIGSAVGVRHQLDELVEQVRDADTPAGRRAAQLPGLKVEIADRYVEAHVARMMSYRVTTMQAKGMIPNHEASATKLFSSELGQRIARTGMRLLGLHGQQLGETASMKGRYGTSYMSSLSSTIAGGTSEIQRNIIAQRGLGLPRS